VDLRCYGITTPRHDGKVSVHFVDIDGITQEWEIDDLPWDAVTPVPVGDAHPDVLDSKLVDAITTRALSSEVLEKHGARQACIAFLYMYMIMAHGKSR
jgi:hypothetical protein